MILGLILLIVIVIIGRPLLFSSFDAELAETRGVPVRALGSIFLILIALTISITTQVVGILLVFALLIGPAATAIRLVHQPLRAIFYQSFWDSLTHGWEFCLEGTVLGRLAFSLLLYRLEYICLFVCYQKELIQRD